MDTIKAVFEEGGFPGVVGVIDGTHKSVRAPTEDLDAYINRKKSAHLPRKCFVFGQHLRL